jgi:hypothetical protein
VEGTGRVHHRRLGMEGLNLSLKEMVSPGGFSAQDFYDQVCISKRVHSQLRGCLEKVVWNLRGLLKKKSNADEKHLGPNLLQHRKEKTKVNAGVRVLMDPAG